jgi:hypothetical protein
MDRKRQIKILLASFVAVALLLAQTGIGESGELESL